MASPKAGETILLVYDEDDNFLEAVCGASRTDVRKAISKAGLDWEVEMVETIDFDTFAKMVEEFEDEDEDEEEETDKET